jgi:hypothetical protein
LLQGLIQLDNRALKQDRVIADLRVLFRGSKQIGLYSTFLAAPALVLHGYQRLLALAGKDIDSAFPGCSAAVLYPVWAARGRCAPLRRDHRLCACRRRGECDRRRDLLGLRCDAHAVQLRYAACE